MPHSYVDDIIKDRNGYIWVATHNGIGRYDGFQFVNYNTRTEPIQLRSDFVHKLCEDKFGRLWVGTEQGISLIDLDSYTSIPLSKLFPSSIKALQEGNVGMIYSDRQGNLWLTTENSLWHLVFSSDGRIADYFRLQTDAHSPIHAVIDLGHAVCVGMGNNLYRIEKRTSHVLTPVAFSAAIQPFTADWRISCMATDDNILWIGTNRGLFKYNLRTQDLQRYRYSNHRPGMLSQAYITDIKLTREGEVIVSTLNGLNIYDAQSDSFQYIRQNNDRPDQSLNCNLINCLLTDGNDIWAGTEIGGINLLSRKSLQTKIWQYSYLRETSLSPNPVNAIGEDREGNLWIGTVEGGLNKKGKDSDEFIHYTFDPKDPSSISNNSITGILVDSENHLWAYTWGVGINELDLNIPGAHRFARHLREDSLGLEGDFLSSACEDVTNQGLWFGTTTGLHFYNKHTHRFTKVNFPGSDNEFESVGGVTTDRKERLWFGTSEGVFILDLNSFIHSPQDLSFVHLKYKLDDPACLRLEKINCIFQAKDGTIWLGSNGNGLYRLTNERDRKFEFSCYTEKDGLPNNTVLGIVEDSEGKLWMSTRYGLSCLDPSGMIFTNYTKEDGLPDNRFYWNAYYYSSRNDLLYFGTINGLVAFSPHEMNARQTSPQVILTSIALKGERIFPSVGTNPRRGLYNKGEGIRLHERDHNLSISFSTQNYGNENRVRYAYRLKGYEQGWNTLQQGEHTAKYSAIPPGRYTFQIHATDEKGHWNENITEVEVRIAPYFYKTWWFILLLICVVAEAGYQFYRYKIRSYRKQQKQLEEEVAQRTHTLARQNEQLESMARHIEDITEEKITFFTNITHEFRTPVTLIEGPLRHALKEITEPAVRQQLQIAEQNARNLLQLVNELMDFRKLDSDRVVLAPTDGNLKEFIDEILLPFEVFARERGIEISTYFHLPYPYYVYDAEYMRKVLVNLLSNAVKFTPDEGRIRVYVASVGEGEGKRVYISVSDSGHGIAADDLQRIFERFYQSRDSVSYPAYGQSSTGIGLYLCQKIVALHGGEIWAKNNRTKGASFRILLPLTTGVEINTATSEEPEEGRASLAEGNSASKASETVLIVDDNADMRAYLRTILQDKYHLYEADNGRAALEILYREHVDLIVSDLMMPVMDGNELSRAVKSDLSISHIPFLMLTAIRSDAQEKASYEIGVDEYLCKPFDEEVLVLRIRNILSLRAQYRQRFSNGMRCEALNMESHSKDNQFMTSAVGLMKAHYADSEYGVDRFVNDMGYSKTLVNNKLQSLTGCAIGQFMKNYRLMVARETLEHSHGQSVSISEVAYAVGFGDPKYFTRCFKELFGMLPSELLKGE